MLEVQGLAKSFGESAVLSDLDLSLHQGKCLAIIGRSGSGKSTLLRCLNLIEEPDTGTMSIGGQAYYGDGKALFQPWEVRRQIGLVLQQYSLFPNFTVIANLELALRSNLKLSKAAARARIDPITETLGIAALYERYPGQLSGGQLQRCALARALVLRPQVLLLDEITSALDPVTVADVELAIRQVRSMPDAEGMSIIIATHLFSFAEAFADDIAYLHLGKLWEAHPARDFFDRAQKPETKRFLAALPSLR